MSVISMVSILTPSMLCHQAGILERIRRRCSVRHAHSQHVLGAQGFGRQRAGYRRIKSTGKADQGSLRIRRG